MRSIIAKHSCHVYLKPGEVIISHNPILVSTILGSCVAITMYSPNRKVGAICHAMYPHTVKKETSLHYVETAITYICRRMMEYGARADMVIKLFGGAQVLAGSDYSDIRKSIGGQNIIQAHKTLEQLGLSVSKSDTGGTNGRKLLFSIKTGDVYLRKLKMNSNSVYSLGE